MDGIYCQGFADRDKLIGELSRENEHLKIELAKLRALCAEAAEQFNRCYDPAMVGRLAAAGRGEG